MRRFLREAEAAARLDQPNIIRVTKLGRSEEGLFFLAMELLSGHLLADLLKPDAQLTAKAAPSRSRDAHRRAVVGPGVVTVLVGSMPAAVATDTHICALPPLVHQPTASSFPAGSGTVLIGGLPALRTTDACGAMAAVEKTTVEMEAE